jgi:hypothetical protein
MACFSDGITGATGVAQPQLTGAAHDAQGLVQ